MLVTVQYVYMAPRACMDGAEKGCCIVCFVCNMIILLLLAVDVIFEEGRALSWLGLIWKMLLLDADIK